MNNILILGAAGYIGSTLTNYLKSKNKKIFTVDINWFNGPTVDMVSDFACLDKKFLSEFSHIILLAGHSSMAMCSDNYESAWNNNVTNFSRLISRLDNNQTLIYASSGSVYGINGTDRKEYMSLSSAQIEYDLSKQIIEKLALGAKCKTIGLRFGTVNGFNNYARSDLMINAMVISALTKKSIDCYNANNHRSILGIDDCVRAIDTIIDSPITLEQHEIFNLASFSGTISTFANDVAGYLSVPVTVYPNVTNNFSFELNCDKFSNLYRFAFNDDTISIVQRIVDNYQNINWSTRTEKITYV